RLLLLAHSMLLRMTGSETQARKEVSTMKKTTSLLSKLLLSAVLLAGTPVAAEEVIEKEAADFGNYCHLKFPPMRDNTLSWDRPQLNTDAEKSIDFYGPCDYDPTGATEVRAQRSMLHDGAGDGSNDSSGD